MDFKNIFNLIQESIPPIHKEGYVFIFIFIMATAVLWALSDVLGFFGLIATACCTNWR
jgi:phosphatidylserine decarboxylase